jgi:hypothetical protein
MSDRGARCQERSSVGLKPSAMAKAHSWRTMMAFTVSISVSLN